MKRKSKAGVAVVVSAEKPTTVKASQKPKRTIVCPKKRAPWKRGLGNPRQGHDLLNERRENRFVGLPQVLSGGCASALTQVRHLIWRSVAQIIQGRRQAPEI